MHQVPLNQQFPYRPPQSMQHPQPMRPASSSNVERFYGREDVATSDANIHDNDDSDEDEDEEEEVDGEREDRRAQRKERKAEVRRDKVTERNTRLNKKPSMTFGEGMPVYHTI